MQSKEENVKETKKWSPTGALIGTVSGLFFGMLFISPFGWWALIPMAIIAIGLGIITAVGVPDVSGR